RDRPDRLVVAVIAGDRDTGPAGRGHRVRRLLHRAGQVPGPTVRRGSRGHVYHPAGLPEGDRHATANPAAAAGHPAAPPGRSPVLTRRALPLAGAPPPIRWPAAPHRRRLSWYRPVSLRRLSGRAVTGL